MSTVEIPLSQGLVALVDAEDYDRVTASTPWAASVSKGHAYAVHQESIRGGQRRRSILMHTLITGWPYVDHINGNGLDNRRANLRPATHADNMHNYRRPRHNTSGFKGVSWRKAKGAWVANIKLHGRQRYLGAYATREEAARAYDVAALELHGEFARLNFPLEG
ncbi:AP2 domain-containing protein [Isoptericola sp. NPDC055881]